MKSQRALQQEYRDFLQRTLRWAMSVIHPHVRFALNVHKDDLPKFSLDLCLLRERVQTAHALGWRSELYITPDGALGLKHVRMPDDPPVEISL